MSKVDPSLKGERYGAKRSKSQKSKGDPALKEVEHRMSGSKFSLSYDQTDN